MKAALHFSSVSFGYGSAPLFADLNLTFEAGLRHALIGPNAAGKTTLFKLATGLVRPQAGQVALGDTPVASMAPRERAQRIAVVPQYETNVFELSVRQLVATGRFCRQEGYFAGEEDAAVERALRRAGAMHLADRSIWGLSGGERQRVLIARALAQEPEWLLLDEPTNFLDLRAEFELIGLLNELHDEGFSILAVTHDLQAASEADRVTLVYAGGAEQGPPETMLTSEKLSRAYGLPVDVERVGRRFVITPAPATRL